MHSVILFASGRGSNVQAILDFFEGRKSVQIALLVSNNPNAGALEIARSREIPTLLVNKETLMSDGFVDTLKRHSPTLIVLAGFLWKIPSAVVTAFPDQIINIHPALLPKYGGRGMYGDRVHEAVLAAGERETGITIHFIDEHYDRGSIILQARCRVNEDDDAAKIAAKIHRLEHFYLPRTIAFLLSQNES